MLSTFHSREFPCVVVEMIKFAERGHVRRADGWRVIRKQSSSSGGAAPGGQDAASAADAGHGRTADDNGLQRPCESWRKRWRGGTAPATLSGTFPRTPTPSGNHRHGHRPLVGFRVMVLLFTDITVTVGVISLLRDC